MLSLLSHVWLFVTQWTVGPQTPLSMGFFNKNTGVGCHALLQGIFQPRNQPCISFVFCIASGFFTSELPRKPHKTVQDSQISRNITGKMWIAEWYHCQYTSYHIIPYLCKMLLLVKTGHDVPRIFLYYFLQRILVYNIKKISIKLNVYSTEDYSHYLIITFNAMQSRNTESVCYIPEINALL